MNGIGEESVLTEGVAGYVAFGDAYRADPALRARAEADPRGVLAERGLEIPPAVDARIVANTGEVFHLVLPPDPNTALEENVLAAVSGGAATASSVSSVGTLSTIPSCAGSASSIGTAGSAGEP